MPAAGSFTVDSTTATFETRINGSQQEAGDVERVVLGLVISAAEWSALVPLVTTKYHLHVPLGGEPILDIVRGPGTGTLVVAGFGTATAVLTALRRSTYLPNVRSLPTAEFLVIGAWT